MPSRIINKSRGIGEKKRGRPPKNSKPADTPPALVDSTPAPLATTNGSSGSNGKSVGNGSNGSVATTSSAVAYTGLSQIDHGLKIPEFDANKWFAGDLFTNSSALPETEKQTADAIVESIEKKRHTLRIVGANIALNSDVVKVATDFRRFEGLVLDYSSTLISNQTKFINYQTAGVNRDIAINRFEQTQERLIQGQKTLEGMRSITPLIDREWEARRSLKESQIKSLQVAAVQAKEQLQPQLMQISQEFKQEFADLM